MNVWVMEYNFHLYTVNLVEKEVTKRTEYHENIETLIKSYRGKKNALLKGFIEYNTDFKFYKAICKQVDKCFVDSLL